MNAIYGRGGGGGGGPPPPPPAGGPAGGALAEGEVRFIADEVTNAVIVTTFPRNWPDIEDTLKKLDRMPRQVLIEGLVAEITLSDDLRLGIEWAFRTGRFDVFNAPTAPGASTTTTTLAGRPTFPIPSLATVGGLTPGGWEGRAE